MVSQPGQTVAGAPLLATKHYAPGWRPPLVARPRLIARLNQGAEHPLTLVSAPAGFGRTTLPVGWLAALRPERVLRAAYLGQPPGDITALENPAAVAEIEATREAGDGRPPSAG